MENTRRAIKNIPSYLYSKMTGKPFHRTMKARNEKKRMTLRQKAEKLANIKKACLGVKNYLPYVYKRAGCNKLFDIHQNITNNNVKNLKKVNVNALVKELVPGNTNTASIRNLPLRNVNMPVNIPTSMYFPPVPKRGGMTRKR